MYLDYFTLAALVDELQAALTGGRIQDLLDVDDTGLGLEIYAARKRHWLYLSADRRAPRLHLAPQRLRRGLDSPLPIGLLARRYVEGGRLERISQPRWERVVQFDIAGPEGDVQLVVEPMERRSNILLLRDGVILECMRRVHAHENRMRTSLPAHPYQPPPPQRGKLDPLQTGEEELRDLLAAVDDPRQRTRQFLCATLLAVSPLLAREAVHRSGAEAGQRARDADAAALWPALRSILEPLAARDWQPGLAVDEAGPTAFSVYPLHCEAGWRPTESINAALVAWFAAANGADAYRSARQPVAQALRAARERVAARRRALQRSLKDDGECESLRQSGELLLAHQYSIAVGQDELRAQYEPEGPELVIPLDVGLTPLENARRYFTRYEKSRRAQRDLPALLRQTAAQLQTLDQLACDLELAGSRPDIDEVQAALQSLGMWRGRPRPRPGGQRSAPLRHVTPDGYVIQVGRNSRQNEELTFARARGADLWLHARGVPGAHVVIRDDGREIPDRVIERAAGLAAWFSAQRGERRVAVDVTRRRHVRRLRGAGPGMVSYRNERTLRVPPRSPESLERH